MRHPFCLLLVAAAAALGPSVRAADDPKDLATRARAVLKAHCYRCHNGDGSSSGYAFDVTRHETLVKPNGDDPPVVVPNSLSKSPMGLAIQKPHAAKGIAGARSVRRRAAPGHREMDRRRGAAVPCRGRPYLPDAGGGAARRPRSPGRGGVGTAPVLALLQSGPRPQQPRSVRRGPALLPSALAKLVNSLSWKRPLAVPKAVDRAETLFAVDVRDLDWDRDDLWSQVVDAYPYGLKYGSHPDAALRDLDGEIVKLSGCDLPWVRADWFIATASRPPLYHDLLQLPKNVRELEDKLGVNVPENFLNDKLLRAGFAKSGVSGQNRLLERHATTYGAYWKSYDFLPENGRANLIRFPLGPVDLFPAGRHPYPEQAFKHDGGEIIFNLPNGLQGYLLVNGKGGRIDAGPIDVVSDDKRVSGTPAIVNGVSCMACHQHGMIGFKDQIRDHSAVFGDAEKKVQRLFPEQKVMDEKVEADRKQFLAALTETVGPFLRVGADKDAEITRFKEPVSEVAIGYRRGYLDLKAVATELFVANPDNLLKKVGERRLKELGLEALTRSGGVVGRFEWEAVDGYSLMQEVAARTSIHPFGK